MQRSSLCHFLFLSSGFVHISNQVWEDGSGNTTSCSSHLDVPALKLHWAVTYGNRKPHWTVTQPKCVAIWKAVMFFFHSEIFSGRYVVCWALCMCVWDAYLKDNWFLLGIGILVLTLRKVSKNTQDTFAASFSSSSFSFKCETLISKDFAQKNNNNLAAKW